jgi:hypothetical protein
MVPGILLIVHIVSFTLAAPVLVQEKRQAYADVVGIPEYPRSVLGKRGEKWGEIEEVGGKYIENWFAPPKGTNDPESSTVFPELLQPDNKLTGAPPQLNKGPSSPSTESESDYKIVVEEPPSPRKESPTKSGLGWLCVGACAAMDRS